MGVEEVSEEAEAMFEAVSKQENKTAEDTDAVFPKTLEFHPTEAAAIDEINNAAAGFEGIGLEFNAGEKLARTAAEVAKNDWNAQAFIAPFGKDLQLAAFADRKKGFHQAIQSEGGTAIGEVGNLDIHAGAMGVEARFEVRVGAGLGAALAAFQQGTESGDEQGEVEKRPEEGDGRGETVEGIGDEAVDAESDRYDGEDDQDIEGFCQGADEIAVEGFAFCGDIEGRGSGIEEDFGNGGEGIDSLDKLIELGDERPADFAEEEVRDEKNREEVGEGEGRKIKEVGVVDFEAEDKKGEGGQDEGQARIAEEPEEAAAEITEPLREGQSGNEQGILE